MHNEKFIYCLFVCDVYFIFQTDLVGGICKFVRDQFATQMLVFCCVKRHFVQEYSD